MKEERIVRYFCLILLMLLSGTVAAQQDDDTCPVFVENALAAVDSACENVGRNQVCYGNLRVEAVPFDADTSIAFDMPGEIVDLAVVQSLQLAPYDADAGEWGISLMGIQANLPETLPGQNVIVLLFGDVEIEDAGGDTPMQAFYFRTGARAADCADVPQSGILIQTPAGAGEIILNVNEVEIALGSTAYLQSHDDEMLFSVIEGQGSLTAFDQTITVPAGMYAAVPLDDAGTAASPPTPPQAYDDEQLENLPLTLLKEAIEVAPPLEAEVYFETLASTAQAHFNEGEYLPAIDLYTQMIILLPDSDEGYAGRGLSRYHMGEYEDAIDDFDTALDLDPDDAESYFERGLVYQTQADFDSALDDYNRAIDLNPQDAYFYFQRGLLHFFRAAFDESIADYTQALSLDSTLYKVYLERGNSYYAVGNMAAAVADYIRYRELTGALPDWAEDRIQEVDIPALPEQDGHDDDDGSNDAPDDDGSNDAPDDNDDAEDDIEND